MMRRSIFFIIISICLLNINALSQVKKLQYSISTEQLSGKFNIALDFTAGNNTSTEIQLPDKFGKFTNAYRFVLLQKGKNIDRIEVKENDSAVVVLHHKPNLPVRFQYTLINALRDSLPGREPAYSIIIKPHYFNIPGQVLFAYPKEWEQQRVNVSIKWNNYPKSWSNVNSFGTNKQVQTLTNIYTSDFVQSIWAGGDYRVYTVTVNKKPVCFAIRGSWHFKDTEMLNMIQKTIAGQRAFWNDYNISQYTVTLMPFLTEDEYSMSYQGTGLANSFATWATTNKNTSPSSLTYLYNHELMHHWIGTLIKNEQPEELLYWFSEGFTEYYTYKNMLESKFISESQYKRSLDSILGIHYNDSVHASPNTVIKENFWKDYKFQKLPYSRGRIFAWFTDLWIQKETAGKKSLKDVMLLVLNKCLTEHVKFSKQLFIETVQQVAGIAINPAIEKYIEQGQFISLEDWNAVSNHAFAYKSVQVFTFGFTTDIGRLDRNAKVTAVDEEANAAKAGLKAGDVLKGFNIYNDATKEAELVVERNKQLLTFKFYPAKQIIQLQLK